MKQNLTRALLGIVLLSIFHVANSAELITIKTVIAEAGIIEPRPLTLKTIEEFLSLTPKKYKELTGKKLSLTQKVSLKYTQYKVKKAIRKGKHVDLNSLAKEVDTSDFHLLGFILGLTVIGVLIAYLIGDRDVIKWAWIGLAFTVVFFLVFRVLL